MNMHNETIIQLGKEYVMNTYGRLPIALVRGYGSYVWDADGKKYLDLVSGIAVNNLGHCHPKVVDAVKKQAELLLHCSNLYWNEKQVMLAKMLVNNSCGTKVFFCNSGVEANEGAIKLARKYSFNKYGPGRAEIITAYNSFHGRTLTALTATGQAKYQKGFEPLTPGFKYVKYNDLADLQAALTPQTCAIMLEPVQGEGGVNPAEQAYLKSVQEICRERDILLIFDEVQTGLGRTGKLFAYEHYGVEPDIFTLAKGLGGGFPIGALVARGQAAETFQPGEHASTFGGNPLAAAAGLAALTAILEDNLPQQAWEKGEYVKTETAKMAGQLPVIRNIRGLGLMIGIELAVEAKPVQEYCQAQGVLVNYVQSNVLRLVPPLIISYEDLDLALQVIGEAIKQL